MTIYAINFRATSGYIADGPGQTYSLGAVYPETRGGLTFGWSASLTANARDRLTNYGPRLAGCVFVSNGASTSRDFTIDLPEGPGDYRLWLALGDGTNIQTNQRLIIKDGATTRATITGTMSTVGAWFDATGVERIAGAWATDNLPITQTFSTGKITLTLGNTGSGASAISHIAFEKIGGGGTPPTGTVTISSVAPGVLVATATYSYSASDQTGFQGRLNGGTPFTMPASPGFISGLTANTAYALEIRAINADGSGAWSTAYNFTTLEADLPAPANLRLDYYSDTHFKVEFDAVPEAVSYKYTFDGWTTQFDLAETKIISTPLPANLASVQVSGVRASGMRGQASTLPVGVAASTVPSTGRDGPGIIWDWKELNSIPGASLVHPRVTGWPAHGGLVVYANSHFLFVDSQAGEQDVTIVPYVAGVAQPSYKVRFKLE